MSKFEIHVTLGRLPKELRDAPQAMVQRSQRAAVSAALPLLQRHLSLATPVGATGKARQSVIMRTDIIGQPVRGFVGYGGAPSTYINFADLGTPAHWPPGRYGKKDPIAPLTYWAARKFKLSLNSAKARRIGYLVARGISRRGTKAQRFIEDTVTRDRAQVQKLMADAALRAIEGDK